MESQESNRSGIPELTWEAIHVALVERVWSSLLLLAIIGLPLSLSRSIVTGWLPVYNVHLAVAIPFLALNFFRKHISIEFKSTISLILLGTVSLAGIKNLSLLSQGGSLLVVFYVICVLLFKRKTAFIISLGFTVLMASIGVSFVNGYLEIEFDANQYVNSANGWAFWFLSTAMFGALIAAALQVYKDSIRSLLLRLEEQRDQIAKLASHDRLTGLVTLAIANDRLAMAQNLANQANHKVALLFIDLDGFKAINDTYGHEAGDVVLQVIAKRLISCIRASDTAARIGGDEFLVLLSEIDQVLLAQELADRIIISINHPINFENASLKVGCSIGIALFPDHAKNAVTLKRHADAAMYEAKRSGRNNWKIACAI